MRLLALALAAVVAPHAGAATPSRQMVRIPAGVYRPLYGSAETRVAPFALDRDPVTREEYFSWRGGRPARIDNPRRPVTDVTRAEAGDFCSARGTRLPTLAEWEYVAAASRTLRNAASDREFAQSLVTTYASRSAEPPGIDAAEINAFGIRGMHDLVWEWVVDPNETIAMRNHAGMHHANGASASHDMSCAGSAIGATDSRDYPGFLRAAVRSGLTESTRMPTLGFRCAA